MRTIHWRRDLPEAMWGWARWNPCWIWLIIEVVQFNLPPWWFVIVWFVVWALLCYNYCVGGATYPPATYSLKHTETRMGRKTTFVPNDATQSAWANGNYAYYQGED